MVFTDVKSQPNNIYNVPLSKANEAVILNVEPQRVARVTTTKLCIKFLIFLFSIAAFYLLIKAVMMYTSAQYAGYIEVFYENATPENQMPRYIREKLSIHDNVEKISVYDKVSGFTYRFVHDFNVDLTGIIMGNNCLIMPLDRTHIMHPKCFVNSIYRTWMGRFYVNTDIMHQYMKVKIPHPNNDTNLIGQKYIHERCRNTFKLAKNTDLNGGHLYFGVKVFEFAGKGLVQTHIINYEDVLKYSSKRNN
ncbi:unnamed protein product [Brassicogethes aeneus]|uniref:Integral membrane protein 2 n=1 Tax=Brassicogethes aeneus TaxID=1431903 RepID=A0A9P0AU92_BRAAE|nr:unnamed protein product [Brassicogethes aeneus]